MHDTIDRPVVYWDLDAEQDVLYLDIGEPTPSLVREVEGVEGVHIRYALSDGRVTGAVILWYSLQDRRILERSVPFSFDFSQARLRREPSG